jgi:hypothetical protein
MFLVSTSCIVFVLVDILTLSPSHTLALATPHMETNCIFRIYVATSLVLFPSPISRKIESLALVLRRVDKERSTVDEDRFTVDEPVLRPVSARRRGGRKGEMEDEPVHDEHQRRAPDVRRRARPTDGGLETVSVGFHCERGAESVLENAEKGEVKWNALFLSLIPYSLTVPGADMPVTNHPCNTIISRQNLH